MGRKVWDKLRRGGYKVKGDLSVREEVILTAIITYFLANSVRSRPPGLPSNEYLSQKLAIPVKMVKKLRRSLAQKIDILKPGF